RFPVDAKTLAEAQPSPEPAVPKRRKCCNERADPVDQTHIEGPGPLGFNGRARCESGARDTEQAANAALGSIGEDRLHSSDVLPVVGGRSFTASRRMSLSSTSSPILTFRRLSSSSRSESSSFGR